MRSACLLAVAWTLLGTAPASAATVLVSGTLSDAAGMPAPGTIRVYAWPHSSRAMSLPLVGTAQAGASGAFRVVAADPRGLLRLAQQRDGWLDFTATAETISGRGEWTFTGFVARTAAGVRVASDASAEARSGAARIASHASAPQIAIRADRPSRLLAAAARSDGPCRPERRVTKPRYARALAVVGELNNAYNDGTSGKFTYGRKQVADTDFGIGVSSDGGDSWFIGGENHISDEGKAGFPAAKRRYARKLRSVFEFSHQAARNHTCAVWDHYVRAESWIGGTNSDLRQPGALNRCDAASLLDGFDSGATYERRSNHAVRWTRGVAVFGVYLTSKSGFSNHVTLEYKFGGPGGKEHYLCGPDGRSSPYEAPRVFSGARK